MRLPFCESSPKFGSSVKDVDGFTSYNRFIVLSSVTSNTIPNILDLLFNLSPFGTNHFDPSVKKTRVLVINTSEVYGSIHGIRDTRNRNVFVHHGIADCDIDQIDGDTPITFTDIDWNVIVDKPDEIMSGPSYKGLTQVQLSYDVTSRGYEINRESTKNRNILIPSPEYYDEKDMIMLGGIDESYGEDLFNMMENQYDMNTNDYIKALHKSTLNQLMDDHTKVYKLNIQIENLSSKITNSSRETEHLNEVIAEICSQLKYGLEHSGYSNAEIILNGKNGYNVTFEKLRSYLKLSPIEIRTNFMLLCGEVDRVNEQYMCDQDYYSLLINIDHTNVKVCIVDLVPNMNLFAVDKTDSDVKNLSDRLKFDNPGLCEFHAAMERYHSAF
jgi:hypothetical protein